MSLRASLLASLSLVVLATTGCQPSGNVARVTVSAPGKVDHYRLLVWDSDSKANLLDTSWVNIAKPGLIIGLKLPREGNYTLVMFGAEGDLVTDGMGNQVPAAGSELFYAGRFVGKGTAEVTASLAHVPGGTNGEPDDDQDRDLWPAGTFPGHAGGATAGYYADKMDLLDCDDTHAEAHPFGTEKCTTPLIDEDCDGQKPPCQDSDGDGDPDDTDCKPMDPAIHHPNPADPFPESPNCCGRNLGKGGTEASMTFGAPLCHAGTCGDGIDQDCDGNDTKCQRDQDCDGALASDTMQGAPDGGMACGAPANDPPGNDCNDCDPTVNPNAPERCDDMIDNNCNGLVNETCVTCDLDGDGFQRVDATNGCPDAQYVASGKQVDCNDDDAGVFPGSTSAMFPLKAPLANQFCKGKEGGSVACAMRQACKRTGADGMLQDVDCNGTPAEGCPTATCDADGDGFVDVNKKATCDPMNLLTVFDCDDMDPHSFPGAPDKCNDGVPQNCANDLPCGVDNDHDGYDTNTDCDDSDANIHPWATEVCDGKDNDCDGLIDEGNPDATGAAMYDNVAKTIQRCNDSSVGECNIKVNGALTGRCVCSPSTLIGLFFTQGNRVSCPGEDQAVDDGSTAAARCFGAYQPQPQSCTGDPATAKDDDCDSRVDAPDGKNLALKGTDCWSAALGECRKGSGTNSGALVIGCDQSVKNCFAGHVPPIPGVNPWLMCDNPGACPLANEKCNGLDDDCNGLTPTNEQDQDSDGYMACWNGTGCDVPLRPGLLGCGDCQDTSGMAAIHPNAIENCNNINDDCDVNCDAVTHQCTSTVTGDGSGQCGKGADTAFPTCCSNQSACRDLQSDFNSCGVCTAAHATNCNPLFANVCVAGGCSCGQSMGAPCGNHFWCSTGVCTDCRDDQHCGNGCVTCAATLLPKCKSDATVCVECNADADCANQKTCGLNGCWCSANVCTIKSVLGVACGGDNQCGSGNCVDGVCCNQPLSMCSGCRQCNLGTSLGTCTSAPNGSDPHNLCVRNDPTCKQDNCDGFGTCNHVNGVVCGVPACAVSAGTATETDPTCGVMAPNGTCGMPTKSCGNYLCNGNVCATLCTSDTDCSNGNYCNAAGQCVTQRTTGTACNLAAGQNCLVANCRACASGNCIDGFCCNTSCGGQCDVCAQGLGASVNGTCTNLPLGSAGMPSCSPLTCTGASATCPANCANDAQCIATSYCDAASNCVPRKVQGSTCNLTMGVDCKVGGCRACASGNCVDGFCCDTACNTQCLTCTAVKSGGTDGTCSPVVINTDPDVECAGGLTCSGGAACRVNCTLDLHCEPGYYCTSNVAGSCALKKAQGLACAADPLDGTGAHQCGSGNCIDGFCCNTACPGTCVACSNAKTGGLNGTCGNVSPNLDPDGECLGGLTCNGGGACRASCTADAQCESLYYCTANVAGACSLKQSQGAGCAGDTVDGTGAHQCSSNNCIDGFCCNTSCVGTCIACSNAKTSGLNGTCTPVTVNTDPDTECLGGLTCSGGASCRVNCTSDAQCEPTFYCNNTVGGSCVARGGVTAACAADPVDATGNHQCTFGNCKDGFCCNAACGALCFACSAAKTGAANGTCAAVTSDTDPDGDCAGGLTCSGGACRTNCTSDSQCEAAFYCNNTVNGSCVARGGVSAACGADPVDGTGNHQCTFGNCIDGFCCNSTCLGFCRACSNAKTGFANGTCANVTSNTDPDGECTGGLTCNAGACRTNCTSDAQCEGTFYCNNTFNGSCVGRGGVTAACAADPVDATGNHQCTFGNCKDGFCCNNACAGTCTACSAAKTGGSNGTCANVTSNTDPDGECLGGLTCNAGACRANCAGDGECESGFYCTNTSGGSCVGLKTNSAVCAANPVDATGDHQCSSAHCTDGRCCNQSAAMCTGCQACDVTGLEGTCSNVPAGRDPHNFCTQDDTTCASGLCNGSNACGASANGVQCSATSCANAGCFGQCTGTLASQTCDGSTLGSCPTHTAACAGNLTCASATACNTSCAVDADCTSTFYCAATVCVAKIATGVAGCATDHQCLSRVCVAGTCRQCRASTGGRECGAATPTGGACSLANTCNNCSTDCLASRLGDLCTTGTCTCTASANCGNGRGPNCVGGGSKSCTCGNAAGNVCPFGQVCSDSSNSGTCKIDADQPCTSSADCSSGTCTAGLCTKLATGKPCVYDSDCALGTCLGNAGCN